MNWTRSVTGQRGILVTVGLAIAVLVVGWLVTRERGDGRQDRAAAGREGARVGAVAPQLVEFVEPEYPDEARREGLEGEVLLKVLVGPDGRVLEVDVVKGVDPLLDEAARDAARRSRWKGGSQRGIPVKAWAMLPCRFALE